VSFAVIGEEPGLLPGRGRYPHGPLGGVALTLILAVISLLAVAGGRPCLLGLVSVFALPGAALGRRWAFNQYGARAAAADG